MTHSVDYGDYGGNQLTARPSGSPPGSTSATELVTRYRYDPVVLKEDADSTDQSFANTGLLHSVQVFPDISDPNGRKTEYKYDFRGRTITVIGDAKVGGMNRRRDIAYDAEGNVTLRTAWNGVQAQKTEYVYGVTANQDGSIVSAADYLYKIKHPIPSGAGAGNPSTLPVDQEVFGYNRQAERIYRKDQNQTVHNYTFDVRGRQELDHVQAFGIGIDQLVHSIDVDYDLEDRMVKVTSLGVGGVTRNQVTFDYDVWGNVTKVGQERNGPVTGSSPTVDLHYTEEPSTGTVETLRLDKATYPSGIQVWVDYAGTGTLADTISDVLDRPKGRRFSASGQWVYQYGYQGAGRILEKQYFYGPSQNTLERERVLDRFGRTDELGVKVTSSGFYWDRLKYDYNGDSTIASIDRIDQLTYAFDQTYEYDSIGRLVDWKRGLLSGGNISNPSDTQAWQLDPSGNWLTHTLQGTTTNTATFHATNEFDTRNNNSNYASYDSAGSMTVKDAGGYSFKYDAWGRVVQVLGYWGYYNFGTYEYDGIGRRIYKSKYNWSTPREYFYGPSWQVLEEIGENINTSSHWTKYVWGDEYIDELAWRSTLVDGPECIVQDENFNVMTKFDADDGLLVNRVRYTPYGVPKQYDLYDAYIVLTDDESLFTGREWQHDSGTLDFRRRLLLPDVGRFSRRDHMGAWGDVLSFGNAYTALAVNPVVYVDAHGGQAAVAPQGLKNWTHNRVSKYNLQREKEKSLAAGGNGPVVFSRFGEDTDVCQGHSPTLRRDAVRKAWEDACKKSRRVYKKVKALVAKDPHANWQLVTAIPGTPEKPGSGGSLPTGNLKQLEKILRVVDRKCSYGVDFRCASGSPFGYLQCKQVGRTFSVDVSKASVRPGTELDLDAVIYVCQEGLCRAKRPDLRRHDSIVKTLIHEASHYAGTEDNKRVRPRDWLADDIVDAVWKGLSAGGE